MGTVTVNISFQDELLSEIDSTAKAERRSRSELLREAARQYIVHKQRWDRIFDTADRLAADQPMSEADVLEEIAARRAENR